MTYPAELPTTATRYRKAIAGFVASAATVVAALLAAGFLPAPADQWVPAVLIAVGNLVGVPVTIARAKANAR